MDRVPNYGFGS